MLDSKTPFGSFFIDEQRRIQRVIESRGYTVISMNPDDHASDILLCKEKDGWMTLCGVAEIKSRISAGETELTVEYLRQNGGYLITNQKLKAGAMLSAQLGVPFFIIVSLMVEKKILIWRITDDKGNYLEKYVTRETKTRKTANGGEIVRTNAFLPMNSPNLTIIE